MSKLARMAVTSHSLSLAAMEEASRTGERTADLEHLLMALSLSEQPAGQVLRGAGVSITALRAASEEQRSAQLASLGVTVSDRREQRIVFHETGGYEWSKRALNVLGQLSKGDGGASAVLRTLLDEPSGAIDELLTRVGVTTETVRVRLAQAEKLPTDAATYRRTAHAVSRVSQVFIPAPPAEVWALLSSAARVPEWDLNVASIDVAPDVADDERCMWNAFTVTYTPEGKPVHLKAGFARQRVELVECESPVRVSWRFSYPDGPKANRRRLSFVIEPAAGGTQLGITVAWELTKRQAVNPLQGVLHFVMRPVSRPIMRCALWIQAAQIASSISRVFR